MARTIFDKVNRLLPNAPQALALVAFTHFLEVMRGFSDDPEKAMETAADYAQKAVALGDVDGFAHIVLGSVRLYQRQHAEAMEYSDKALGIRKNCPLARAVHSNVLHFSGQDDLAIKNIKTAVKHARIYPPWMANLLSASYRDAGHLGPSMSIANESLRLNPNDVEGLVLLCTNYVMSGSLDDAREVAERILTVEPVFTISGYMDRQPYKDESTMQGVTQALRDAGLPE